MKDVIKFIRRYKVLHVLFWSWSYTDLFLLQHQHGATYEDAFIDSFIIKVSQMMCVYAVVYYLMPVFLHARKYTKFILQVLAYILLCSLLMMVMENAADIIKDGKPINTHLIFEVFVSNIVENTAITLVFFAVYSVRDSIRTAKQKKELERGHLEIELNFLQSQINPHFLFNVINSIYVLIEEDSKLATQTLLRFSDLLRYQLYDCTKDLMPLDKELAILKTYIDLEKLRNGNSLNVFYSADEVAHYIQIAPLILIPFAENAFKNASKGGENCYIKIDVRLQGSILQFSVTNTYDKDMTEKQEALMQAEAGLQNIYRRLELLYPGRHSILINKYFNECNVQLELDTRG